MKFVDSIKSKIKSKIKNNTFFTKQFGFENGVDITNDEQVLYRKNTVIKNIIFLSNLFYTAIFFLIALGDTKDWSTWVLTILFFPVTFIVNNTLKKLIKKGPKDNMSQQIAMYVACFYIFLSAIIVYIKLRFGSYDALSLIHSGDGTTFEPYLKEVGYILLYYSLAVCSFYQDKKLLKNIFLWVFIIVTILHFIVTYNIFEIAKNYSTAWEFIQKFFSSADFKDILLRTILLLMFMLVLYIYVSMASYMQEERKKELIKRREVQEDFTNVVTKIFDVTLSSNLITEEEKHNVNIISIMSKKLASLFALDIKKSEEIGELAKIHIDNLDKLQFDSNKNLSEDERFEALRKQTELGSKIITRLQLSRKCEDIVRAALEGSDTDEFRETQRVIQNNIESEIILISELYVTMRSVKSYKRAYNHQKSIQFMENQCKFYFDPMLFDRFIKFASDFEQIYDEI